MLKKLTLAIAAASTVGASGYAVAETFNSPVGEFDVSMTATLASDYIWRGQSQTAGKGAVQGSVDVAHESGFYAGIWASNVDDAAFQNSDGTKGADVEFDYYLGYAGNITDDISYDLGWAVYTYPQAHNLDVKEWLASVSAYGFTVGTKYAYDPDSKLYTYIAYDYELPYGFGIGVSYGLTDNKDHLNDGVDNKEKYKDWSVGLSKTFAGLDMALVYTDTNLKNSTCSAWYGKSSYCSDNVTFSVSKSF